MTNQSVSQEKIRDTSHPMQAILLSLGLFLIWTIATYLLEGRINLLQEPTLVGRYTYVLAANVVIGTVGGFWLLRALLRSHFITLEQIGLRSMGRTVAGLVIALLAGGALILFQRPAQATPLVLLNGFIQVLPVSIAEVVICWAIIGISFETLTCPRSKILGIVAGIIAADLLFAFYHIGHSAPFNQLNMMLMLLIPGFITSLVYFLGREIYAAILIQNSLATVGVLGNMQDLTFLSQPLPSFYVLALIAVVALIGADLELI